MAEREGPVLFIFPGQGSQYRGIGSDLHHHFAVVRETYQEAAEVLGYDIARLSFEDPEGQIHQTCYTQPVLLTHHIATLRVYREQAGEGALVPSLVAGHSLGEYAALVEAGVLTFADALRLVAQRGALMSSLGEGEMLALTIDLESARELADTHYCAVAGINLPDQTVVAGASGDLDALAAEMAQRYPRKRAIRLQTEGAFHTYYMVEAARRYRLALAEVAFQPPRIGVLSNYTGTRHTDDAETIRARLFLQLFHPVNWVGCMATALAEGVTQIVEFGGGIGSGEGPAEKRPNLEGMVKKLTRTCDPKPHYQAVINRETLQAVVAGA